jgi:hypothetical protein
MAFKCFLTISLYHAILFTRFLCDPTSQPSDVAWNGESEVPAVAIVVMGLVWSRPRNPRPCREACHASCDLLNNTSTTSLIISILDTCLIRASHLNVSSPTRKIEAFLRSAPKLHNAKNCANSTKIASLIGYFRLTQDPVVSLIGCSKRESLRMAIIPISAHCTGCWCMF